MLDLLAFAGERATNLLLLYESNFAPAFYDLSTGLAGEIVQKFSNYQIRAAIIGTFNSIQSGKFREFMIESNKGHQLHFVSKEDAAVQWLIH